MKIRPVNAELFHVDERTDGQTDMTKLIVTFCNFSNAPKNASAYNLIVILFRRSHVYCCDENKNDVWLLLLDNPLHCPETATL
jgi:hypothetical protein